MQRTTRVDVTTSSTNHAVCTAHDHYCVIFSAKSLPQKLTLLNYPRCGLSLPIPLATRSKAWACDRLRAGITGSNPARAWMCLLKAVCCQVEVLADHLSRAVLLTAVCLSVIVKPR